MVVLIIATGWIIISANLFSFYTTVYIWYFVYSSSLYIEIKWQFFHSDFKELMYLPTKKINIFNFNWEGFGNECKAVWTSIFSTESILYKCLPPLLNMYIVSTLLFWSFAVIFFPLPYFILFRSVRKILLSELLEFSKRKTLCF